MTTQQRTIAFEDLQEADLFIDAIYKGGSLGHAGDDPISKLVGCGNQGGFRYVGQANRTIQLCVLYSTLSDLDWPDMLDPENGVFVYYGDNKRPGHDLHSPRGNRVLRNTFSSLHTGDRSTIPPFLIFTKGPRGRDVIFRGLAVPGAIGLSQYNDLVAIWKTRENQRFQNYKATFTILEEPVISRVWIDSLRTGESSTPDAPKSWHSWRNGGPYQPLLAPRTLLHRTRTQQVPEDGIQKQLLTTLVDYFNAHPDGPYAFEHCAAEIARFMDSNIVSYDLTRPWRDGGRDALGVYRIGHENNSIDVEFALEAKCYDITNGSGVRDTSRLISRLRHRQFGIFVTTSYVSQQAYQEIIEDGHPVIILSAIDIAELLIIAGYSTVESLQSWLSKNFLPDLF